MQEVVLAHFASQHVISNFSGACVPRGFDIDAEACEGQPGHRYYIFPARTFHPATSGTCHENGDVGLCSNHDRLMKANGGRLYGGGIEVPFDFGRCAIASPVELEGFGRARSFLSERNHGRDDDRKQQQSHIFVANAMLDHMFTSTGRTDVEGAENFALFLGPVRRRLSSYEYQLVSCVSKKGQEDCPWARWIALLGLHCPHELFEKRSNLVRPHLVDGIAQNQKAHASPNRCKGTIGIISAASPYAKLASRRKAARESWIIDAGGMVVPLFARSRIVAASNCFTYFFVIGRPSDPIELEQVMQEQEAWGDLVVDTGIQDQVCTPGGEPGNLLKTWRFYSICASINASVAVRASDDVYIHVPRLRKLWDASVLESKGKMVLLGQLVQSVFLPHYPHFGSYIARMGSGDMPWLVPVGDLIAVDLEIVKFTLSIAELPEWPAFVPQFWAQDDTMGTWLHFMARNKVHYASMAHGIEWKDVISLPYDFVAYRCSLRGTSDLDRVGDRTVIVHFGGLAGNERSLLEGLAALHSAHEIRGDITCAFSSH